MKDWNAQQNRAWEEIKLAYQAAGLPMIDVDSERIISSIDGGPGEEWDTLAEIAIMEVGWDVEWQGGKILIKPGP